MYSHQIQGHGIESLNFNPRLHHKDVIMSATTMTAKNPEMDLGQGLTRLFGVHDVAESGLVSGWAAPEEAHIWNDGLQSVLRFKTERVSKSRVLTFEGEPFLGGDLRFQDVTLYANGFRIGFWRLHEVRTYILSATIEPEQFFERSGASVVTCLWHLPGSARPVNLGMGSDTRELGFCFRSITLD
jgi:hypothetical protein